jgi:hypothetical protein
MYWAPADEPEPDFHREEHYPAMIVLLPSRHRNIEAGSPTTSNCATQRQIGIRYEAS